MIAQINITTFSGYVICAFAEMCDSQFQELSGGKFPSDLIPKRIRQGIIPSNLICEVSEVFVDHEPYKKLGVDPLPESLWFKIKYWFFLFIPARCLA